jgi:hypothetical protein
MDRLMATRLHEWERDGSTTWVDRDQIPLSVRQRAHCTRCGLTLTVRAAPANVEAFLAVCAQAPCPEASDA